MELYFKIKNNISIKFYFKKINNLLFQPVITNSDEIKISLLFTEIQAISAINKLKKINNTESFPYHYLYNVIAGALKISMKEN